MKNGVSTRNAVFELASQAGKEQPELGALRAIAMRQEYAMSFAEVMHGLDIGYKTLHRMCRDGRLRKTREKGFITRASFNVFCRERLGDERGSGNHYGARALTSVGLPQFGNERQTTTEKTA